MASRKLVIEVVGDASKLDKTFKQASSSTQKFGKSLDGLTTSSRGLSGISATLRGGGIALGLGVATNAAIDMAEAASALNEQVSRSKVVFGSSAKEIEQWASGTAKSMGISKRAALEAASTFGGLFSTVGIDAGRAAELSKTLVGLAADLASFTDVDPSEALAALRSGLIGEAEPLRRFNVRLSESRVQQQAMSDTGKKTARSLTDLEKITARYEIILKDTAKAQGDFERTSGSLANQQRVLGAQVEDNKATLGGVFLPVVKAVVTGLNQIPDRVGRAADSAKDADKKTGGFFSGTAKAVGDATGKVKDFGIAIHELGNPISDLKQGLADVDAQAKAFGDTLTSLPGIELNPRVAPEPKPPKKFGDQGFGAATLKRPLNLTPEQKNTFFDNSVTRELDKAEDLALDAQIDALEGIAAKIQKRIAVTKDITRKLNLEDQLRAVQRKRRGLIEQQGQQAQQDKDNAAQAFLDSLELGVSQATLTATLTDDLAKLQSLKAGLEKQIAAGQDVAANQQRLVDVTQQIASVRQQQGQSLLDALSGRVDDAATTRGVSDDIKRLEQFRDGIQKQIQIQGKTVDLVNQLDDVNKRIAAARKTQVQERQFQALGLDAEGGDKTPGVANLRKQLASLTDRIGAADLGLSSKLKSQLAGARKILSGELGAATEESRQRIADLFATIRGEFDRQGKKGPLTKTTTLNANNIIDGLGLGPDAERALRARLSHFNSAGVALKGAGASGGPQNRDVVVDNRVVVELDGKPIAANTTKRQQKSRRRNPSQRRGPNAGLIIG